MIIEEGCMLLKSSEILALLRQCCSAKYVMLSMQNLETALISILLTEVPVSRMLNYHNHCDLEDQPLVSYVLNVMLDVLNVKFNFNMFV